jgi:serine/threonine-protein kinase
MTPERWQQVKEVLNGALHVGGEERAAFLGRACQTDPSLRIEVDALLASAPGVAEEFLKSAPPHRLQLAKGSRLGPYEIDSLIGTGGMGEVIELAIRGSDESSRSRSTLSPCKRVSSEKHELSLH